jgi:tRNA wybutosine-synthesizing protein 3
MKNLPTPGNSFTLRKQKILSQLSVPDEEYSDASPKGSVDAGIRHLIDQLNRHAGLVTTSSCAGRVSVYLEGRKTTGSASTDEAWAGESERASGNAASSAGGKGGGEWLFVSHDPVEKRHDDAAGGEKGYEALLLGLQPAASAGDEAAQRAELIDRSSRLIHFKFEPMVLINFSPERSWGGS